MLFEKTTGHWMSLNVRSWPASLLSHPNIPPRNEPDDLTFFIRLCHQLHGLLLFPGIIHDWEWDVHAELDWICVGPGFVDIECCFNAESWRMLASSSSPLPPPPPPPAAVGWCWWWTQRRSHALLLSYTQQEIITVKKKTHGNINYENVHRL